MYAAQCTYEQDARSNAIVQRFTRCVGVVMVVPCAARCAVRVCCQRGRGDVAMCCSVCRRYSHLKVPTHGLEKVLCSLSIALAYRHLAHRLMCNRACGVERARVSQSERVSKAQSPAKHSRQPRDENAGKRVLVPSPAHSWLRGSADHHEQRMAW